MPSARNVDGEQRGNIFKSTDKTRSTSAARSLMATRSQWPHLLDLLLRHPVRCQLQPQAQAQAHMPILTVHPHHMLYQLLRLINQGRHTFLIPLSGIQARQRDMWRTPRLARSRSCSRKHSLTLMPRMLSISHNDRTHTQLVRRLLDRLALRGRHMRTNLATPVFRCRTAEDRYNSAAVVMAMVVLKGVSLVHTHTAENGTC
jgi:hypothetical protein